MATKWNRNNKAYSQKEYNEWLHEVDVVLMRNMGLTSIDLADYDYQNAYRDGLTPLKAAEKSAMSDGYVVKMA